MEKDNNKRKGSVKMVAKSNSSRCPKCEKPIKAHQGNLKDFKELSLSQMNSSIGVQIINLKRCMRLYAIKSGRGTNQVAFRVISSFCK